MTRENLLVRVLNSCETMANASVVCTDKTGTLTQNEMTVVAGTIGSNLVIVRDLAQNPQRASFDIAEDDEKPSTAHHDRLAVELRHLNDVIPAPLCSLLTDSIALNSTAFEDADATTGSPVFVGSKTETALLTMARDLDWANYKAVRDAAETLQVFPFSSERKAMGVVVRLPGGRARLYVKGASEILLAACTRQVLLENDASDVETVLIDEEARMSVHRAIIAYASQTLRTIAIGYRDFDSWPPMDQEQGDEVKCFHLSVVYEVVLTPLIGHLFRTRV